MGFFKFHKDCICLNPKGYFDMTNRMYFLFAIILCVGLRRSQEGSSTSYLAKFGEKKLT